MTILQYMMLTLTDYEETHRLGLVPIPTGSCSSKVLHDLVVTKLNEFQLSVQEDIVAITSDGASVMKSLSNLLNIPIQLCINHGTHLSITDELSEEQNQ